MSDLEVLAVTADAAALPGLPLRPLIRLLVERLARNLRDRVWLVRLRWGAAAPSPPHPPVEMHLDAMVAPALALRNFVDGFAAAWSDAVDLLLLDPSELYGGPLSVGAVNTLLVDALKTAAPPTRISHIITDPAQWQALPFAIPTQGVELLPTALLPDSPSGNVPGASWIALFDDLANSTLPTPGSALGALADLAQGVTRYYADGGPSAAGDPARAWPLDAVKLRPTAAFLTVLATHVGPFLLDALPLAAAARAGAQRTFERWARAVTARRVGLALGGGGAHSYVGVAFLEEMGARKIPLDIVGGTSFGSIVAGYYAVRGDPGLAAIVRHWYWAQLTVLFGWLTTSPLQLWLDFDLGFSDINDLEVTFVPIAANAYTGHAWHLRIGVVGHTCAASGSLPPLSPTYDGNVRLLDGALTAGVPAAAVAQAGAGLVAGANVVPYPPALPPDPALPLPRVWNALRSLNPLRRLLDFSRGYQMLVRQGAHSQDTHADVVYPADTEGLDGTAFYASQAIVDQAKSSTPFTLAIDQLEARWRDLLRHLAGRIRYWHVDDAVFLGGDLEPGGARVDDLEALDAIAFVGLTAALTPDAQDYLQRIADLMSAAAWMQIVIRVDHPDVAPTLGLDRLTAIRNSLLALGIAAARLGDDVRYGAGIAALRVQFEVWLSSNPLPTGAVTMVP